MTTQDALDKLRRPLEFLVRNEFKNLGAVAGLERTVSVWVAELEASGPPQSVLEMLTDLRAAFRDFDAQSLSEKRVRVHAALKAVNGLQKVQDRSLAVGLSKRKGRRSIQSDEQDVAQPCHKEEVSSLADSILCVRGVGPRRAETLARIGIRTVGDALFLLPRKYVDRSSLTPISAVRPGREETFVATILGGRAAFFGRGRRIYEVTVGDDTGIVTCVWFAFRAAYMKERYQAGRRFMFSGVVRSNPRRGGRLEIHHPEVEEVEENGPRKSIHTGRIVPFYPSTEGLNQRSLRTFMKRVVDDIASRVVDVVPKEVLARRGLAPLGDALRGVHFPPEESTQKGDSSAGTREAVDVDALNSERSPWHRRLFFDELFGLQTGLAIRKDRMKRQLRRHRYRLDGSLTRNFLNNLPFALTAAQKRVVEEIQIDLRSSSPMNRLLQGDVGSGKTVVAVWTALAAIESGHQATIMAPTEILAEQHAASIQEWIAPLGARCDLLTGRVKGKTREAVLKGAADGSISLLVGTHALIREDVQFKSLAFSLVDEQHRFGVVQRSALRAKGEDPDVLVMTATPIPRSLALTLYGDLDLSVLDEMPPGRRPVETLVNVEGRMERPERSTDLWRLLRRELEAGRQAYYVLPLVEETERSDLKAAVEMAERLARDLEPFAVGLLHGRMKGREKDVVMRDFREGKIRLLVTTTVIEVGIDVPDATVMWIEHADRYGLAQLHQLRGRVGRGAEKSYCILRAHPPITDEAEARLAVMAETSDGFTIADRDLDIRGPGEVFGKRQAGTPDFRFSRLLRHADLLAQAREDGFELVKGDPNLSDPRHRELRTWIEERWGERLALAEVG